MRDAVRKTALAGIVLSASACGMFNAGPETAAVDYLKATLQGDAGRVDRMMEWGPKINEHPNEKMILEGKINSGVKAAAAKTKAAGGLSSIRAVSIQLNTVAGIKMATVMVEYRLHNGEIHTEAVKMIEQDGQWLVKIG